MFKLFTVAFLVMTLSGCASNAMQAYNAAEADRKNICAFAEMHQACGDEPINHLVKPGTPGKQQDKTINACHWQVESEVKAGITKDLEIAALGIPNYNYVDDRQKTFDKDWSKAAVTKCGAFKDDMVNNTSAEWVKYRKDMGSFNVKKRRYQQCQTEFSSKLRNCRIATEKMEAAESGVTANDKLLYHVSMTPVYVLAVPVAMVQAVLD